LNLFGIGPAELLLIFILAFIIFGPKRLPEVGRSLGKAMREFRSVSQELTNQFRDELEAATDEIETVKQAATAELESVKEIASEELETFGAVTRDIEAVTEDIKREASEISKSTEQSKEPGA
jgi:sec-independent protein translocase protein TatA